MRRTLFILLFSLFLFPLFALHKYVRETLTAPDGRIMERVSVPGIPVEKRIPGPVAVPTRSAVILSGVPAFDWCYGCSATSAAMMAAWYDRGIFNHTYTGPTNGGQMPLNNSVWGPGECPLSATHQSYDGLSSPGHVERFWTNNSGDDPFGPGDPTGTYFGCTADYMGTNQQWWGNGDGSTSFVYWVDGSPFYDPSDGTGGPPYFRDGMHGLRLFFESRGYGVSLNYNQDILGWGGNTNGYTLDQFRASINAGIPVMIQVEGHSMVGIGYESDSDTIYILNTWDYDIHSMTWGGSYSNMAHYGVGVLELIPPPTMSLSGTPLFAALQPGAQGTDSFSIFNTGTGPLHYQIELSESTREGDLQREDRLATKDGRSIAGSTLTIDQSCYDPGTSLTWTFTLYNGGTDDEWLKHVYLSFPAGITVNSATNFIGGGGGDMVPDQTSGTGITIHWLGESGGWGVVYPGNSATANVSVSISATYSGDLVLPWQINGDVYGAEPHELTGMIVLPQNPSPISWLNVIPIFGTVQPGSSLEVTGYFDAAGLTPGTYQALAILHANDPWQPVTSFIVALEVQGANVPVITDIYRVTNGMRLEWNPVPGAASYKVYRSSSPNGGFGLLGTSAAAGFTDNGNLSQAFYRVTAVF
jgi:hypothetical protein